MGNDFTKRGLTVLVGSKRIIRTVTMVEAFADEFNESVGRFGQGIMVYHSVMPFFSFFFAQSFFFFCLIH